MHAQLLAETGGADGVRDEGLLESALEAPYAGVSGEEFYPSVEAKAAWLVFGPVVNHPFVDGNKRVGILAMLVLLDLNGIAVRANDHELVRLGLDLAERAIDTRDVLHWILAHAAG